MYWFKENISTVGALLVFLIFFLLAVAGGMHAYSPVPFWDMWGATLGFFIAHSDGNTSVWWALHNEHRIVLSRVLFWLDYKLFDGTSAFLIAMNYVFVMSAIAVFYQICLARLKPDPQARKLALISASLIGAWLFQWMQEENLAWAFQSQFFLAQLLPLCALLALYQSSLTKTVSGNVDTTRSRTFFMMACVLGVASAGTMANGVIALPLMTLYSLVMRQHWLRSLTLTIVSMATTTLYFSNYNPPPSHGSLTDTLLSQPVDAAHYVLLYLGTPFYMLFGGAETGAIAAVFASIFMGLITTAALVRCIRNPHAHGLSMALVIYIIFLAGTALGTAGGRLVFGVYQALTFRYTTPALMAWAALFVLCLPWIIEAFRRWRVASLSLLGVTFIAMLSLQLQALEPKHQQIFDRAVAALALELGVKDETQISTTYVMSDGLIGTAEVASAYNLSVFGMYPWRDLRPEIGRRFSGQSDTQCLGHLDSVERIEQDNNYLVIRGWLFDRNTRQSPELIRVVNGDGITAGFALTGQPRPDVADAVNRRAGLSGFIGYVNMHTNDGLHELVGDNPVCVLPVDLSINDAMDGT